MADSATAQRTLEETTANDYPHVERGITLGTVVEHSESGDWALVIDIPDDADVDADSGDQIRILNLEEVTDTAIATLETASGCVEHARCGRDIAAGMDGGEYIAPVSLFDALGPLHPAYQRDSDQSA